MNKTFTLRNALLALTFLVSLTYSYGQSSTCAGTSVCGLNLDGFSSTLPPGGIAGPNPLCPGSGVPNNIQWFGFTAGTTNLTFTIDPSGCTQNGGQPPGMQVGIYTDCSFTNAIFCDATTCFTSLYTVSVSNLVVGEDYFIFLDGCSGSVCNYTTMVLDGSTTLPPVADASDPSLVTSPACAGSIIEISTDPIDGGPRYNWTLPAGWVIIGDPNGQTIQVQLPPNATSGQVCVYGSNACGDQGNDACALIDILPQPPPQNQTQYFCPPATCFILPENNQCYTQGSYVVTIPGGAPNGCDQRINLTVRRGNVFNVNSNIVLCPEELPYDFNGTPVGAPGTYTVNLTTWNGCDSIVNLNVTVLQPFAIIDQNVPVLGCGGNSIVTISGNGSSGGTLQWTAAPGNIVGPTNLINARVNQPGTYILTVTAQQGNKICRATEQVVVDADFSTPDFVLATTDITCAGQNNGVVSIEGLGGGVAPYMIRWSTGQMDSLRLTNLAPGTYRVTITGANACSSTQSVTLVAPPLLNGSITNFQNPACFGQTNGTATVSGTGGTPPYTFAWSSGQTTATVNNLPAGNFIATVTDSRGCRDTARLTLVAPSQIVVNHTATNVACFGGNTANINLTTTGGTGPFSYNWDNAPDVEDPSGLTAGPYNVTVTDARNCTTTHTVTITQPTAALGVTNFGIPATCGQSNGSISITATGGTTPYSYNWSNGGPNAPVQNNLPSGNYSITVTDANNCTVLTTINLVSPGQLTFAPVVVQPSCNGSDNGSIAINASAGNPPYNYDWSNNVYDGQSNINNLAPGVYAVTVTDGDNCSLVASFTISEPAVIGIAVVTTPAGCNLNNGTISLTVSGGTGPYNFDWSENSVDGTEDPMNLPAGVYTVTVTDANQCTQTATATIINPNGPQLQIVSNDATCNGVANGSITVNVTGGDTPYSYAWSGGLPGTGNHPSVNAGTYSVTVSDANNCTVSSNIVINQPAAIALVAVTTDANCFNSNTGNINLTASGGVGPYSYRWNLGAANGEDPTDLPAGSYVVTITDANNCTYVSGPLVINEPAQLVISNILANAVSCNGGNNGTINVSVSGGTTPYTYAWSNTSSLEDLTNLSAGSYLLTVTDANNCTAVTNAIQVTQPAPIAVTLVRSTDELCNQLNGALDISVAGGVGPYTYNWSNTNTTQDITNLAAGTYEVTVTDANNCTEIGSFSVRSPDAPVATASLSNVLCFGGNSGAIDLNVTGGKAPYTYTWNAGLPGNQDQTSLIAGTYTVVVADADGCRYNGTYTLTEPTDVTVAVDNVTNTQCAINNGGIDITVLGGTTPYTFRWNPGNITTEDPRNLGAGGYTVTVTDANGCTETATAQVNLPVAINVTLVSTNVSCNGGSDGTITSTITGGQAPFTYNWTFDLIDGIANPTGLSSGTYTLTITDANLCAVSATGEIAQPPLLVSNATKVDATCRENDGQIALTVTGGTAPFTFDWSNDAYDGQQNPTGLVPGAYSVTVTDDKGCTTINTLTIGKPTPQTVQAIKADVKCFNGRDGSIQLGVTGGQAPFNFDWNQNAYDGRQNLSNIPAGFYEVTVTDAKFCTATTAITINQPNALALTETIKEAICGEANGAINITVSGGTPTYTYNWRNNGTNEDLVNVLPGQYFLTVTDRNGCTLRDTFLITAPTAVSANFAINPVSCFGGTDGGIDVTITQGVAPYQFDWNGNTFDGQEDITGVVAGNYNLTITDANQCKFVLNPVVTSATAYSITTTANESTCGLPNGTINLTVTGSNPPYSFAWSNGVPSVEDPSQLAAGSYTVTITDAKQCTATRVINITTAPPLAMNASVTDATCFGVSNGGIAVVPSGGTSPYRFSWNRGLGPDQNQSGIAAGTYTVTVTDANDCTVSQSFTVNEPNQLIASFNVPSSQYQITCPDGADGSLDVTVNGGSPGYTYNWNVDAFDGLTAAAGLKAGIYQITVTDRNGCTSTDDATLIAPPAILVSGNVSDANCNGSATGSININVQGGNGGFTYLWSNNSTSNNPLSLTAGQYNVVVADAKGCSTTSTFTVSEPAGMQLNFTVSDFAGYNVTCPGEADGFVNSLVNGGVQPYSYTWSTGSLNANLTDLFAGTYAVTVTDKGGCTISRNITLTQPAPIVGTLNAKSPSCFGLTDGAVVVDLQGGGAAPFKYRINGGPAEDYPQFYKLGSGNYTIVVEDANGCTWTQTAILSNPAPVVVDLGQDKTIKLGESILLEVNFQNTDLSKARQYGWEAPEWTGIQPKVLSQTITPLNTAAYEFEVVDEFGCVSFDRVTIFVDKVRNVGIPTAFSPNGDNNGGNDIFSVNTGVGIEKIEYFRVFDRWGNMLYEANDFVPDNVTNRGWNGEFKGQKMPPGVYVYVAKVKFIDGFEEIYQGDVTLIR